MPDTYGIPLTVAGDDDTGNKKQSSPLYLPEEIVASESGCSSGLPDVCWLTRSHGSILVGVVPGTGVVPAHGARVVGRKVHYIRGTKTVLGVVERGVVRARSSRAVEEGRGWRDRGSRRGTSA